MEGLLQGFGGLLRLASFSLKAYPGCAAAMYAGFVVWFA